MYENKNINMITEVERSPYFGGEFREYAKHQWDIKYYGFQDESEIAEACFVIFGDNFEELVNSCCINAEFWIDGRSGGWLCTNRDLSIKELRRVTDYIKDSLKNLPEILKNYRTMYKD